MAEGRVCVFCGAQAQEGDKFCGRCGNNLNSTLTNFIPREKKKSQYIALVLCFFFGCLGVHDCYLERNGCAVAKFLILILLGWIFGLGILINAIWSLVDFFIILFKGYDNL